MGHIGQNPEQSTSGWMPSADGGIFRPVQGAKKIRKIEAAPRQTRDIVGRLRASCLGQLYVNRLKKYVLVRWVAHWVWRNGYPIYINYATRDPQIKKRVKRWRPLVKLNELVRKNRWPTRVLANRVLLEWPEPKVYPAHDKHYLASPHTGLTFPEIYVATLHNAATYGGTNLVLFDGKVICHDLYDFERDDTSEELHGRTLIDPKSRRIRWLLHDKTPEQIPEAATFVDACASNYAHWMTEVLPRIALFCADGRFDGIPIVVNDGLHENIMESLLLVAGSDREILMLPIGRALAVSKLHVTSVTGYVPFGRRGNKLSGHSDGLFSPRAFEVLRDQAATLKTKSERQSWPDKIYLSRKVGPRKVVNAAAIEKLLFARGYVAVEPEKLTFLQQIQLFSHAREIVSPTGAALANAIACQPGTHVSILMSKHKDMIYGYWNNLLSPFGINVNYILGDIVENHGLGIHGDFTVDIDCMRELLENLEKK